MDAAVPPPPANTTERPTSDAKANLLPNVESITHYFHSLEKRVKFLEAELSRLTGSSLQYGEGGLNPPGYRTKRSISANPKPLELNRDQFDRPDPNLGPIHAIELLVHDGTVIKIRIRSEKMVQSLYEALDLGRHPSKSIVMTKPFKALMMLRDYEERGRDYNFDVELDSLIELLYTDLASEWDVFNSLKRRTVDTVSFLHLRYLFQPGDVIVEGKGKIAQAYRIRSVQQSVLQSPQDSSTGKMENASSALILDCFFIGYDGQKFGPARKSFTIMHFLGSTQITKLPIVPIEYHRNENLEAQLIDRGKLFYSLRKPRHMSYSGLSLDKIAEEINGEVIVDLELYYRENPHEASSIGLADPIEGSKNGALGAACSIPGCDCMKLKQNSDAYDDSVIDKHLTEAFLKDNPSCLEVTECNEAEERGTLANSQLTLLPNVIQAFDLRGRKWHPLDINRIHNVIYLADPFEYLVLPAGHKEVLTGLVSTHTSRSMTSSEPANDVVVGRGKGLILLLHGAPGVGKTSTAECVATSVRRPLLPITAADIGDTAHDVERNLRTFFVLSERWGCVLLFDEADIVLQTRDRTSLQRNAIVSVFLRAMEYYTGILVLTTNRVGTIDEAFKSRIHVVLYYPPLDRASSMKIWEIALRRAEEDKNVRIRMTSIMPFLEHCWDRQDRKLNGRDIRNAVQSAIALAEYEHKLDEGLDYHRTNAASLRPKHFEKILDMANNFDKYTTAVHGGTDDVQARRRGDRIDDFGEKPKYVSRAAAKPLYTTSRLSERLGESRIQDRGTGTDSD